MLPVYRSKEVTRLLLSGAHLSPRPPRRTENNHYLWEKYPYQKTSNDGERPLTRMAMCLTVRALVMKTKLVNSNKSNENEQRD